jgi:hypothetical protein
MVEVAHLRTRFEQAVEGFAVLRQRDVEHGDTVTRLGLNPFQKTDVALGSGDQFRFDRIGQA